MEAQTLVGVALEGKIIRADGTEVDLGTLAEWNAQDGNVQGTVTFHDTDAEHGFWARLRGVRRRLRSRR